MGNKVSSNKIFKNISNNSNTNNIPSAFDYMATEYIMSMDFNNLRKMYDKSYCNKLTGLTSKIIDIYYKTKDIHYLLDRVQFGDKSRKKSYIKKDEISVNSNADMEDDLVEDAENAEEDNDDDLNADNEDNEDTNQDVYMHQDSITTKQKEDICIRISMFYVQIAHIFAVIITALNPTYIYTDNSGQEVEIDLQDKDGIERIERKKRKEGKEGKEKRTKTEIQNRGFCNRRINELNMLSLETGKGNNKYKNTNIDKHEHIQEQNIPEFEQLYYDSNYNPNTGTFEGMSAKTKIIFEHDLKQFYTHFTGNLIMPQTITKFGDIQLKDYDALSLDQPTINLSTGHANYRNKLFQKYSENLKQMMIDVNKKQNALLQIISKLIVTTNGVVRINPALNEQTIKDITIETRNLITELYLKCEDDFNEGIKIHTALVYSLILFTAQNEIQTLQKEITTVPIQVPIKSHNIKTKISHKNRRANTSGRF